MFRFLKRLLGLDNGKQAAILDQYDDLTVVRAKDAYALAPYKLEPPEPTMIVFEGVSSIENIVVNDNTVPLRE